MKKTIIISTLAITMLNGCETMTRGQKSALAGVLATAAGVGIAKGTGASTSDAFLYSALAGVAVAGITYALATDSFTQTANQQATSWQNEVGASTQAVSAPQIIENGQTVQRIDTQKMVVPTEKMVVKGRLAPKAKEQLIQAKSATDQAGGKVQVVCPATATKTVLDDIKQTGVTYSKDNSMSSGYEVLVSRNSI